MEPRLLQATPLELEAARALKAAATNRTDEHFEELRVDLFSDFDIVQHAIATNGDLEQGLDQMLAIQHFREEYQVQDTLEDALTTLTEYVVFKQSACLLHVHPCVSWEGSHFIMVLDAGVFDVKTAIGPSSDPHNWRTHVVTIYYLFHSVFPHIAAMRQGCVILMDFAGMTWDNATLQYRHAQRMASELLNNYPVHCQRSLWYNTPTFANVLRSFLRSVLQVDYKIYVGCRWENPADVPRRLAELFAPAELGADPTVDAARAAHRVLSSMKDLLILRFRNVARFSLSDEPLVEFPMRTNGIIGENENDNNEESDNEGGDDDDEEADGGEEGNR